MKIWRLKKGGDLRFRSGHPWIFSGEMAHSTKEVRPGEVVELRDAADKFLAVGMAHPSASICFRKLTTRPKEVEALSVDFFVSRLKKARELRVLAGLSEVSHRWLFSEADGVPGLILDVFKTPDHEILVFQISTAGMEAVLDSFVEALKLLIPKSAVIVDASTSSHRKIEGLEPRARRVLSGSEVGLEDTPIRLLHKQESIYVRADFRGGQKTGFFLDQQWNTQELLRLLPTGKLRTLDICSYVGQWSAQIAKDREVEAHVFDASESALDFAEKNLVACGGAVVRHLGDALKDLARFEERSFDVVICDPPAFVKKKADFDAGLQAYIRLNRDALKLVRPGGIIVSASCSGSVRHADFRRMLSAAERKAGRIVKTLFQGGHGPDHPVLIDFPEGEYLKCSIGVVDFPY